MIMFNLILKKEKKKKRNADEQLNHPSHERALQFGGATQVKLYSKQAHQNASELSLSSSDIHNNNKGDNNTLHLNLTCFIFYFNYKMVDLNFKKMKLYFQMF